MFGEFEDQIIARLRSKLGGAVTVEPEREVARVKGLAQKAPAVWVVYDGFRLGNEIPGAMPGIQQLQLDWVCIVQTKSARGNGDAIDARDAGAALSMQVIEALVGFDMGRGKRLRLIDSAGPEYDAGYCEIPLAFTCAVTVKGTL